MAEEEWCGWESDIQFVLEVQKRPCLYDRHLTRESRNQYCRQRAWHEIARIVHLSASACLGKWRTIRDRYVRTYRKSGPGANGVIEDPTWNVSSHLSFLNPYIRSKRTTGNFTEFLEATESPQASQSELPVHEDKDEQSNTMQDVKQVMILESSPTAENSPECNRLPAANTPQSSSHSDIPTDTAVTLSKGRLMHQNTIEKVLEALKAPIVLPASPAHMKRDADELFLLSLLPDFKGLQPQEKTRVKIKILQLIQDAQGLQPTQ